MDLTTIISRASPFPILGAFSILSNFNRTFCIKANSEDPDQTPHYAVSDLDLHCLPMSHKKDSRLRIMDFVQVHIIEQVYVLHVGFYLEQSTIAETPRSWSFDLVTG